MSNLGGKNVSEDTDKDLGVDGIVAGTNIDNIDSSDPRNPIINATTQAGGQVDSVVGGTNCSVDAGDPVNPIVNADTQNNAKVTTKGDLEGFSTVAARIPIGTDTHVLTADSSEALGLKWAPPAGGGGTPNSARITRLTNQTMDGNEIVQFTAATYDDDGGFEDLGTNNDRFTIPSGVTRVNISIQAETSGISASTYVRMSIDHLDSGLSTIDLYTMMEADTGSGIPAYSVSLQGLPVTATDVIRFRFLTEDASWTLTKARAVITDVSP